MSSHPMLSKGLPRFGTGSWERVRYCLCLCVCVRVWMLECVCSAYTCSAPHILRFFSVQTISHRQLTPFCSLTHSCPAEVRLSMMLPEIIETLTIFFLVITDMRYILSFWYSPCITCAHANWQSIYIYICILYICIYV
jgi:hypothetical protein